MTSPSCHQPGRCKRTPCGSSWWWRMCSWRARSHSCCQLGRPADHPRLSGGQLRPTDRAMAARSACMSSSEEESRSTDEEEWKGFRWKRQSVFLSLPGRCAHRAGSMTRVPDSEVFFSFQCDEFCASMIAREPTVHKNKTEHCRGAVGTSTRAVACVFVEQATALLCTHSTVLSPARSTKITKFAPSALSPSHRSWRWP